MECPTAQSSISAKLNVSSSSLVQPSHHPSLTYVYCQRKRARGSTAHPYEFNFRRFSGRSGLTGRSVRCLAPKRDGDDGIGDHVEDLRRDILPVENTHTARTNAHALVHHSLSLSSSTKHKVKKDRENSPLTPSLQFSLQLLLVKPKVKRERERERERGREELLEVVWIFDHAARDQY